MTIDEMIRVFTYGCGPYEVIPTPDGIHKIPTSQMRKGMAALATAMNGMSVCPTCNGTGEVDTLEKTCPFVMGVSFSCRFTTRFRPMNGRGDGLDIEPESL